MNNNKRIDLLVDLVKMTLIILVSLGAVAIIVFAVSEEPANAIYSFFVGPFTSGRRLGNIVEAASPLMFTALAVIIIFGSRQFSMISEGSFFIGCTAAMVVSIAIPLPTGLHAAVAIVCGGICGALVASIPALLKLKWDVSELVTSIMLNYVITFFSIYLVSYHFREPESSSLASLLFADSAKLPVLVEGTRIHFGVILGLLLCAFVWMFFYRTSIGQQLRITGDNPLFSKYCGLKVGVLTVGAQVLAGAIAGMGGSVETLGMYTRFKWTASPGYGWTGIIVAMLARNRPQMVPFAALFIGYLNVGADIMARSSDVSREVVDIIQGVMMLLIAADALLGAWKQRLIVKATQSEEEEVRS